MAVTQFPGNTWNLPAGEEARQAVAPLRGYAYQLHQSVAAWIALAEDATLFLEVAEDYATIARDPTQIEEVLTATQVKETRESGSVTLNSQDVLDAIKNLWAHQKANPGRQVHLKFLTASPVGTEHIKRLENGVVGITAWQRVARDKDAPELAAIRKALSERFESGDLSDFIRDADDAEFRDQFLRHLTFACGQPDSQAPTAPP